MSGDRGSRAYLGSAQNGPPQPGLEQGWRRAKRAPDPPFGADNGHQAVRLAMGAEPGDLRAFTGTAGAGSSPAGRRRG